MVHGSTVTRKKKLKKLYIGLLMWTSLTRGQATHTQRHQCSKSQVN